MNSAVADREWKTLADLVAWLEAAPTWAMVPAAEIGAQIRALQELPDEPSTEPELESSLAPVQSWRERIWQVHPETRLGRDEVCEALGKSRSWLYKKTSAREIPCFLDGPDGELAFRVGELREWMRAREVRISTCTPHLEAA